MNAPLAQRTERPDCTGEAGGSNPSRGSTLAARSTVVSAGSEAPAAEGSDSPGREFNIRTFLTPPPSWKPLDLRRLSWLCWKEQHRLTRTPSGEWVNRFGQVVPAEGRVGLADD